MKIRLIVVLMLFVTIRCLAQKEVIVKHAVVGIEQKTLKHYGGMETCKLLLEAQLKEVDRRINDPDVFDFKVKTVVDTLFVFEGEMNDLVFNRKESRPYDIRIFYDGFPDGFGGWWGTPYFTIAHKWSVTNNKGSFDGYATDGIVHEYGHTMQMYDLYAIEVQAEKNPVNGKEYRSINSIMNYCYDNKMWDELTVFIMNANRYGERPDMTSLSTYFPAEIGVKVVDPKGKAVVGATVNFYPGKWYDYSIAATYSHQGISNSRGVFCFSHNPFVEGKEVKIPSLLIEITHKGEKYYDWLPVNELQLAWVKGAKASYLKTVQISK